MSDNEPYYCIIANNKNPKEYLVNCVSKTICCPYKKCSANIPYVLSVFPGIAPIDTVPDYVVDKLEGKETSVFITIQGPMYKT